MDKRREYGIACDFAAFIFLVLYIASLMVVWICDYRPSISTCYEGVWCLLWMVPWLISSLLGGAGSLGQLVLVLTFLWPLFFWIVFAWLRFTPFTELSNVVLAIGFFTGITMVVLASVMPHLFSGYIHIRPSFLIATGTPFPVICVLLWSNLASSRGRGDNN